MCYQVGGYDLIYRTGFVKFDHNCTVTSYLGCHNNRQRQLKRLAKQIKKRKVVFINPIADPKCAL
jgi:hypothetical protein